MGTQSIWRSFFFINVFRLLIHADVVNGTDLLIRNEVREWKYFSACLFMYRHRNECVIILTKIIKFLLFVASASPFKLKVLKKTLNSISLFTVAVFSSNIFHFVCLPTTHKYEGIPSFIHSFLWKTILAHKQHKWHLLWHWMFYKLPGLVEWHHSCQV